MKIEYISRVEGTIVLPFIVDAYVYLRKSGNIEEKDCPVSGEEEAFYILNTRKKIVAVLSFYEDSTDKNFVINMGYVLERYRKKGYYRTLWNKLVEEGNKRGLKSIIGIHKPGNSDILKVNKKLGRRIKYICSEFLLSPELKEHE
jgi:predicted GNAT family acetyltransferase